MAGVGIDRTFVIADVRGYTRFTREHGDAAAARLASVFADLARDAVEARGGEVLELRGDEALCVFTVPAQAVRAALEFQALCAEEYAADPTLPLNVGIGVDAGEAIPVQGGFRGAALNMAARLCSNAGAGQVFVSETVAGRLADATDLRLEDRGEATLKGFDGAVRLIEAADADPVEPVADVPDPAGAPPCLRRWTPRRRWSVASTRCAGSAAPGVRPDEGAAAWSCWPAPRRSGRPGWRPNSPTTSPGAATSSATPAWAAPPSRRRRPRSPRRPSTPTPTLLVLDDLDAMGPAAIAALEEALPALAAHAAMVVCTLRDDDALPALTSLVERIDERGDGERRVAPLDDDGVRGIVEQYVDLERTDVPLESFVRSSGGSPGRVHEVVGLWAREEASRRLEAAAEWMAAGRSQRVADLAFANDVIGRGLQRLYTSGPTPTSMSRPARTWASPRSTTTTPACSSAARRWSASSPRAPSRPACSASSAPRAPARAR